VPLPVLARMVHVVLDGATLAWVVDRDTEKTVAVLDQMVDYLAGATRKRRSKAS
jgi:hypothetical protein